MIQKGFEAAVDDKSFIQLWADSKFLKSLKKYVLQEIDI